MRHRKEPLLAKTQVISVMDLLRCAMCKGVVSQPLKLHCNAVACASCVTNSVVLTASTQCPCCQDGVSLVPALVQPSLVEEDTNYHSKVAVLVSIGIIDR